MFSKSASSVQSSAKGFLYSYGPWKSNCYLAYTRETAMSMPLPLQLRREHLLLAALLVAAAFFLFWHLSRPDVLTDESSYATRAIGPVDFDFGIRQPTPWEWVKDVPWWMHLSFHDHPPLVFFIQHFSIRLFGETPFAFRLPSALAGLVAVWLVYLIGKHLWSAEVGFASTALFAFTVNHVWISRIGLQESIALALILAAAYSLFRALEHPRWFLGLGVFLGLGFLAKYLVLGLVPAFVVILLMRRPKTFSGVKNSGDPHRGFRRNLLFSRWMLFSVACFLLLASPVIIYNIQLWRDFGHFDFQFSLLFHQNVAEWQARPGQESLGDTANRIRHFVPWLIEANSPYFLAFAALGMLLVITELALGHWSLVIGHSRSGHWSLVTVILVLLPFLVFVGPAYRFLTILTPWFALAAGYALVRIGALLRSPRIAVLIVTLIVIGEAAYAANSVIVLEPKGSMLWTHSKVSLEARSFGYNELEAFIAKELVGKRPEIGITFDFPFAQKILRAAARRGEAEGLEAVPWGIVYPDGINPSAQLWIFLRRITYSGWPVTTVSNFKTGGVEAFWKETGIKKIYAVNVLEGKARARGIAPQEIKDPNGNVAFRVYELAL